jgi:hypothetical protein
LPLGQRALQRERRPTIRQSSRDPWWDPVLVLWQWKRVWESQRLQEHPWLPCQSPESAPGRWEAGLVGVETARVRESSRESSERGRLQPARCDRPKARTSQRRLHTAKKLRIKILGLNARRRGAAAAVRYPRARFCRRQPASEGCSTRSARNCGCARTASRAGCPQLSGGLRAVRGILLRLT